MVYYLVGQTLSTTSWHQNKNITTIHCGINYFSLIWAERTVSKYSLVVDLKMQSNLVIVISQC